MLHQIFVFLSCALLGSAASAAEVPATDRPLRLAATYLSAPNPSLSVIDDVRDLLNREIPQGAVLKFYEIAELEDAIRKGEVDLVISGAGFYVRMQTAGLRALATLVTDRGTDPDRSNGTVMVVLDERRDLRTIPDLKGRTLAATVPRGFQGYQIGMGEIAKFTDDPFSFFKKTLFVGEASGTDMRQVLDAVLSGKADVGFIKTCYIEDVLAKGPLPKALRIINPQAGKPLACLTSTELYPNWSVASMPSLDHRLRRRITTLLLAAPPDANGNRWTVAGDYRNVDDLNRVLRIGRYEYLNHWTLERIWQEYAVVILLIAFAVIGGFAHMIRSDRLVEKRTRELSRLFEEKQALAEKTKAAEEKMERLQRAGIVGQLSTLFAHEMKQPLNSLTCYAHGMLRLLDEAQDVRSLNLAKPKLLHGLRLMSAESQRAAQIVERVRSYARPHAHHRRICDLRTTLKECADEFASAKHVPIDLRMPSFPVHVEIDPMSVKLAVLNLLRNGQQAASDAGMEPKLSLVCVIGSREHAQFALIRVLDNGPSINDDIFTRISDPLFTTKVDGLGLGLSLVRSIAERYGGSFDIRRAERGEDGKPHPGLIAEIALPIKNPAAEPNTQRETL